MYHASYATLSASAALLCLLGGCANPIVELVQYDPNLNLASSPNLYWMPLNSESSFPSELTVHKNRQSLNIAIVVGNGLNREILLDYSQTRPGAQIQYKATAKKRGEIQKVTTGIAEPRIVLHPPLTYTRLLPMNSINELRENPNYKSIILRGQINLFLAGILAADEIDIEIRIAMGCRSLDCDLEQLVEMRNTVRIKITAP